MLETSVMDALVIFSSENNHPMSWLLHKERRHAWCAVRDTERGHWLSYDWAQGIPRMRCEAPSDFDLKSFYQEQGFEVVETMVGTTPPHGPLQWNNCVGHIKTILALNTYALVPNGLYKHLTRRSSSLFSFIRDLSFVPGFGGARSYAPLPPPVAAVPAPQSAMAKAAEKNLSDADQKRLKLGKYKAASKAKATKKKTLLSTDSNEDNEGGPFGNGNNSGGGTTSDPGAGAASAGVFV